MTKELFEASIYRYCENMSAPQLPVLGRLERETNMKHLQAVMLSGHLQGAFLQMLSKICSPQNILEIGTFTGYSAICLAQGLVDGGQIHTIEKDAEKAEIINKFVAEAELEHKVVLHIGDAHDIIKTLNIQWDIVFIDADKTGYEAYYDAVFPNLRPGGLIIADNVLFEGKVLLPLEEQGKNEKALHQFNQKLKMDERAEVLMLPLRDGVSVIRKVK